MTLKRVHRADGNWTFVREGDMTVSVVTDLGSVVNFSVEEWAAIVAGVSANGGTPENYFSAERMHTVLERRSFYHPQDVA